MNKVICIEGPDFTGKSTLGRHFASLGWFYLHASYEGLRSFRKTFQANQGKQMVLDRSWVSERVYGPILRPDAGQTWTEDCIMTERTDPLYIFCQRPFDACYDQQASQEKEHRYPKRVFKKIWNAYNDVAEEFRTDFYRGPRTVIFDSDKYIKDIPGFLMTVIGYPEAIPTA